MSASVAIHGERALRIGLGGIGFLLLSLFRFFAFFLCGYSPFTRGSLPHLLLLLLLLCCTLQSPISNLHLAGVVGLILNGQRPHLALSLCFAVAQL